MSSKDIVYVNGSFLPLARAITVTAINGKSPTAVRMLKFSFNLIADGLVGQQIFAGEATRLAYMTDEAVEGRDAFLQKRDPDFRARDVPAILVGMQAGGVEVGIMSPPTSTLAPRARAMPISIFCATALGSISPIRS